MSQTLFLHYGPGGNAQVEKEWFSSPNKTAVFWDQPSCENYQDLKTATMKKAKELINSQGAIKLCGHSFGCNLALDIASELDKNIYQITLCAPLFDIPDGFFNLADRALHDAQTPIEVKTEIQNYQKNAPSDANSKKTYFWNFVSALVKDPSFSRLYWVDKKKFEKYIEIVSTKQALNLNMWQKILGEYTSGNNLEEIAQKIKAPTQILFGERDPYLNIETEKMRWSKLIPNSKIKVISGIGHFCHLEWSDFSF